MLIHSTPPPAVHSSSSTTPSSPTVSLNNNVYILGYQFSGNLVVEGFCSDSLMPNNNGKTEFISYDKSGLIKVYCKNNHKSNDPKSWDVKYLLIKR